MRERQEAAIARLAELDKLDRDQDVRAMFKLMLYQYIDRSDANTDPACNVMKTVKVEENLMALIGAKAPVGNIEGAISGVVETGDGFQ